MTFSSLATLSYPLFSYSKLSTNKFRWFFYRPWSSYKYFNLSWACPLGLHHHSLIITNMSIMSMSICFLFSFSKDRIKFGCAKGLVLAWILRTIVGLVKHTWWSIPCSSLEFSNGRWINHQSWESLTTYKVSPKFEPKISLEHTKWSLQINYANPLGFPFPFIIY